MLDLNKLEKKLDEALARETPESLRTWLLNKRFNTFIKVLGDGEFDDIIGWVPIEGDISMEINIQVEVSYSDIYTTEEFLIAA